MFRTLIPALIFALPATVDAGEFIADAFGLVPADALSETRATWSGLRTSGETQETIDPDKPFAVLVFVGPKSLVAGKDDGHAVALVLDASGNPVTDDIATEFTIGSNDRGTVRTRYGIADLLFTPDPSAGILTIGATIGRVQSPRALVRVTADLQSVSPEILPPAMPVPVETLATLATAPIFDQYGNPVEDGVSANWVLQHEDGRWTIQTGTTIDEVAEVDFMARDVSTDAVAAASVASRVSEFAPVSILNTKAAFDHGIRIWEVDGLDAVSVQVGPITTDSGYLLNDGAGIELVVQSASGRSEQQAGWIRDGYFQTMLPLEANDGPFAVTVTTVLGSKDQLVPIGDVPPDVREVE